MLSPDRSSYHSLANPPSIAHCRGSVAGYGVRLILVILFHTCPTKMKINNQYSALTVQQQDTGARSSLLHTILGTLRLKHQRQFL